MLMDTELPMLGSEALGLPEVPGTASQASNQRGDMRAVTMPVPRAPPSRPSY